MPRCETSRFPAFAFPPFALRHSGGSSSSVNRKALLYDSGVLLTGKRLSGGDSAKSDLRGRNRQDEKAPHVKRSSLRREPIQRWTQRFLAMTTLRQRLRAPISARPAIQEPDCSTMLVQCIAGHSA